MVLMDSNSFDRQHYVFGYVRNDFLGNTPTAVFAVTPVSGKKEKGRFFGQIWVETHSGNVVRFNGEFSGSERRTTASTSTSTAGAPMFSPTCGSQLRSTWKRKDSQERIPHQHAELQGHQPHLGLCAEGSPRESENTSLDVVGATDVSNEAQDVSPLGAQRAWVQQAEDNVVERLFQAGLLDAPSEFDKTLEALAGNILAYNNITLSRPIRCRTLLTEPLESLAIGNTIVISKSLLDTTGVVTQDGAQQMGNLNAILAFQIAHIILAHRLDTKYAFNDRLLFPTTSVFNRIPMHHTDADNAAAAKKAMELLSVKELEGGQQYFSLYLQQLLGTS